MKKLNTHSHKHDRVSLLHINCMNSSVAAIAQVLNQSQLSTIVNWFPGIFLCEKEVRDKLKKFRKSYFKESNKKSNLLFAIKTTTKHTSESLPSRCI